MRWGCHNVTLLCTIDKDHYPQLWKNQEPRRKKYKLKCHSHAVAQLGLGWGGVAKVPKGWDPGACLMAQCLVGSRGKAPVPNSFTAFHCPEHKPFCHYWGGGGGTLPPCHPSKCTTAPMESRLDIYSQK